MGGRRVTEWSGACSYAFNLKKKDWDRILFRVVGFDLRKLRGTLAQGELTAWGQMTWRLGGISSYDVHSSLEDFQLRDIPDGAMVVDPAGRIVEAVSGAGYPGVAALDILGNVIPYISNEEEKMEEETQKLLGKLNGNSIVPAPFAITFETVTFRMTPARGSSARATPSISLRRLMLK